MGGKTLASKSVARRIDRLQKPKQPPPPTTLTSMFEQIQPQHQWYTNGIHHDHQNGQWQITVVNVCKAFNGIIAVKKTSVAHSAAIQPTKCCLRNWGMDHEQ